MEIHELNDYSGSLGATDYLAIDDGSDTGKVTAKRIIDEAVNKAKDQMPPSIFYGTSSTSASTATKVVDCSDFTELFTGATIAVKFTNAQTSTSSVFLNVNGTGAKQVYGVAKSTTSTARMDGAWEANEVKLFVYDGTYWMIVDQNLLTSSQLSTLETKLGLSGSASSRLFEILDKVISGDIQIIQNVKVVTLNATETLCQTTAPITGKYLILSRVWITAGSSQTNFIFQNRLTVNGGTVATVADTPKGRNLAVLNFTVADLAQGDSVSVATYSSQSGTTSMTGELALVRIGA